MLPCHRSAIVNGLTLLFSLLSFVPLPAGAWKHPEPGSVLPLLNNGTPDALAGSLRGYLVRSLPNPLYESSPGWGHTKKKLRGEKKQGVWRKLRVWAENPADHLVFDIRDVSFPEPGRILFTAFIAFDARAELHQQRWEAGVKLFDGTVRARFRIKLTLHCEATTRLEATGLLLPDAVFRLRVVQSQLQYDNLVVEHIAGVGGEVAKIFGDVVKGSLHQWDPSLERDLLAKGEAAIVKAADTKEVRVSLTQLLKKQKPPAKEPGKGKGMTRRQDGQDEAFRRYSCLPRGGGCATMTIAPKETAFPPEWSCLQELSQTTSVADEPCCDSLPVAPPPMELVCRSGPGPGIFPGGGRQAHASAGRVPGQTGRL
jgi:hypothetical protein